MDKQLDFEESTHTYRVDGRRVRSVSQILEAAGLTGSKIQLESNRYALNRGTQVHLATQLYEERVLDFETLDPVIIPYLEAWKKFLADSGFQSIHVESRKYHSRYRYAGTIDRIGLLDEKPTIIDIKTGAGLSKWVPLQLAGYAGLACDSSLAPCDEIQRYACLLTKDGDYKLTRFSNTRDWAVFCAALTLANWKEEKGYE